MTAQAGRLESDLLADLGEGSSCSKGVLASRAGSRTRTAADGKASGRVSASGGHWADRAEEASRRAVGAGRWSGGSHEQRVPSERRRVEGSAETQTSPPPPHPSSPGRPVPFAGPLQPRGVSGRGLVGGDQPPQRPKSARAVVRHARSSAAVGRLAGCQTLDDGDYTYKVCPLDKAARLPAATARPTCGAGDLPQGSSQRPPAFHSMPAPARFRPCAVFVSTQQVISSPIFEMGAQRRG